MKRLKFLSILMVAAILAGVVTFSACNKDDDPADEGRKAAKEICACFDHITSFTGVEINEGNAVAFFVAYGKFEDCIDRLKDKYAKYEDNSAFDNSALKELAKCAAAEGWLDND